VIEDILADSTESEEGGAEKEDGTEAEEDGTETGVEHTPNELPPLLRLQVNS
jgi:hypothetical protein